jgi:hypothetical protein
MDKMDPEVLEKEEVRTDETPSIEWTEEEERRMRWKLDLRIVPTVFFLFRKFSEGCLAFCWSSNSANVCRSALLHRQNQHRQCPDCWHADRFEFDRLPLQLGAEYLLFRL